MSIPDWPEDQPGIVVPAIQAVKKWKYKPSMKDGNTKKMSIDVEVVFEK
jgi:hypothetical protein